MTDQIENERRAQMRRTILRVLNRVDGGALPENILFADSNLHVVPKMELSEYRDQLIELRDMGLVDIIPPGRLYSQRKIMITDEGRLALAEVQ